MGPRLIGDVAIALAAFHDPGEHLAEQFGGRPLLERDVARRVMVAGEQPPQLALAQDRHRHRGGHAHVAQIFDVDRRDRAKHAHRQVEQPRIVRGRRDQRRGRHVDVGDDAQPVALIQDAGLPRDVRGRIMQPEKPLEPGFGGLGDHLARTVRMKLIDHHPVEPGQHFQLARRLAGQLGHAPRLADPLQHQADDLAGIDAVLGDAGLRLDDEIGAGEMDRDVVERPAGLEFDAEYALGGIGSAEIVDAPADHRRRTLRDDRRQRLLEQIGDIKPEEAADIVRRHADREIGQYREQEAERLNAAGNVDRLAIAIGEIDGLVHARSDARSNAAKAARAESTASSSSHDGSRASRDRKLCQSRWPAPWRR